MGQNLVNRHLAAEEWTQVDAGIAQAVAALEPVLVPVSATTKKVMVKMGDGSEAFCRRAYGVMLENLQLMPRGFDIEEMRRDLEAHDALNARITTLTRLLEKARNAEMALGSDVMVAALEGYAVLKAVGKGEGINELKKLLGRRFEGGPRAKDDAEVPEPAAA